VHRGLVETPSGALIPLQASAAILERGSPCLFLTCADGSQIGSHPSSSTGGNPVARRLSQVRLPLSADQGRDTGVGCWQVARREAARTFPLDVQKAAPDDCEDSESRAYGVSSENPGSRKVFAPMVQIRVDCPCWGKPESNLNRRQHPDFRAANNRPTGAQHTHTLRPLGSSVASFAWGKSGDDHE
jgi:hypothetical protein